MIAAILEILWHEALQNAPDAFIVSYEEECDKGADDYRKKLDSGNFYGFFTDDKLIAIALLRFNSQQAKTAHKAYIGALYVRQLARGAEIVQLGVNPERKTALALYERLGFTVYGCEKKSLKRADGGYEELLLMVKEL